MITNDEMESLCKFIIAEKALLECLNMIDGVKEIQGIDSLEPLISPAFEDLRKNSISVYRQDTAFKTHAIGRLTYISPKII